MIAVLLKLAVAGTVCYAGSASPGHSYAMSGSRWVNATSRAETVTFVTNDPWIIPAKASFTLRPGQSADIPVTLVVPPGKFRKGVYVAKLRTASGASQDVMFGIGVRAPCAGPSGPPLAPAKSASYAVPLLLALALAGIAAVVMHFRRSPLKRTWGRDMKKRDSGVVPPGRNDRSSRRRRGEYRRRHHD